MIGVYIRQTVSITSKDLGKGITFIYTKINLQTIWLEVSSQGKQNAWSIYPSDANAVTTKILNIDKGREESGTTICAAPIRTYLHKIQRRTIEVSKLVGMKGAPTFLRIRLIVSTNPSRNTLDFIGTSLKVTSTSTLKIYPGTLAKEGSYVTDNWIELQVSHPKMVKIRTFQAVRTFKISAKKLSSRQTDSQIHPKKTAIITITSVIDTSVSFKGIRIISIDEVETI